MELASTTPVEVLGPGVCSRRAPAVFGVDLLLEISVARASEGPVKADFRFWIAN